MFSSRAVFSNASSEGRTTCALFAQDPQGRFSLTPLADPLRSDAPGSQRAIAVMMGAEFHEAWGQLLHPVRTGEPGFNHRFEMPFFEYLTKHAISDIVALAPVPANIRKEVEQPTPCGGGAALVDDVKAMLREAGFGKIRVEPNPQSRDLICDFFPGRGLENYFASATIEALKPDVE